MTPWWRVDLQAIYGIITVRMLNRGDPPPYAGKCTSYQIQQTKIICQTYILLIS